MGKIAEDTHCYAYRNNWAHIIAYLDSILEEQRAFGIAEEHLTTWRRLLQQYLSRPTDHRIMETLAHALGLSKSASSENNDSTPSPHYNPVVAEMAKGFYNEFEQWIVKAG